MSFVLFCLLTEERYKEWSELKFIRFGFLSPQSEMRCSAKRKYCLQPAKYLNNCMLVAQLSRQRNFGAGHTKPACVTATFQHVHVKMLPAGEGLCLNSALKKNVEKRGKRGVTDGGDRLKNVRKRAKGDQ